MSYDNKNDYEKKTEYTNYDNSTVNNIIDLVYDRQKKNYIQHRLDVKLDIYIRSQNKPNICY